MLSAFAFFTACAANYNGPRELFFTKIIAFISKATRQICRHSFKNDSPVEKERAARELAIKKLNNYLHSYQMQRPEVKNCCLRLFGSHKNGHGNIGTMNIRILGTVVNNLPN